MFRSALRSEERALRRRIKTDTKSVPVERKEFGFLQDVCLLLIITLLQNRTGDQAKTFYTVAKLLELIIISCAAHLKNQDIQEDRVANLNHDPIVIQIAKFI